MTSEATKMASDATMAVSDAAHKLDKTTQVYIVLRDYPIKALTAYLEDVSRL
jgi:hypothetical protein